MKQLQFTTNRTLFYTLFLIAISLVFVQCKKDDPEEINEEEVINRVTLTLMDESNNSTTFTWNEGATIPTLTIAENTNYTTSVSFYDASNPSDIEDITEEVIEEADEHLVFYEVTSANVDILSAPNDINDSEGMPTNLKTVWTVGGASSGTVRLYLIHEPTSKSGNSRAAFGGSTDIELNFPVQVE